MFVIKFMKILCKLWICFIDFHLIYWPIIKHSSLTKCNLSFKISHLYRMRWSMAMECILLITGFIDKVCHRFENRLCTEQRLQWHYPHVLGRSLCHSTKESFLVCNITPLLQSFRLEAWGLWCLRLTLCRKRLDGLLRFLVSGRGLTLSCSWELFRLRLLKTLSVAIKSKSVLCLLFGFFKLKCSLLFDLLDWITQLLGVTICHVSSFVPFQCHLRRENISSSKSGEHLSFWRGIAPEQDNNGSQKSNYIWQKGLYPVLVFQNLCYGRLDDFTSCWSLVQHQ